MKRNLTNIVFPIIIVIGIAIFLISNISTEKIPEQEDMQEVPPRPLGTEKFEIELMEIDGVKYFIPLGNINHVCPLDCIPSLENPIFETASESTLRDDEIVIGIDYNGVRKAYPYSRFREVVNDFANEKPILITWCPLCGTGIAFEREIDREEVEFGVSGKLLNSDLILYDRKSFTLWQQINGLAIVGENVGKKLTFIPADNVKWIDWKIKHPDTLVLAGGDWTSSTGQLVPYEDVIRSVTEAQPVKTDTQLPRHEFIMGLEIEGVFKAYSQENIKMLGVINDKIAGVDVVLFNEPGTDFIRTFKSEVEGEVLEFEIRDGELYDKNTGTKWSFEGIGLVGPFAGKNLETIIPVRSFWFGWVAFHPDTDLYTA